MNSTPWQYLISLKIERAKELLLDRHLSIHEICTLVGYADPSHFPRVFKHSVGLSPRAWRQTQR
jgi:AraC-like DNA-binding protein